jgi:hypothetical protein
LNKGSSDFNDPMAIKIDSGEVPMSSNPNIYIPAGRPFDWSSSYYWRVRVKDTQDWSGWFYPPSPPSSSPGVPFDSGDPWPWPDFHYKVDGTEYECNRVDTSCSNQVNIAVNGEIDLINKVMLDHSDYCPNGCNYLWNFGNGSTSTLTNPTYTYSQNGIYTLSLTVEDNNNAAHACKLTMRVAVGTGTLPPPSWIEIPPF